MPSKITINAAALHQWLSAELGMSDVKAKLTDLGYDDESINIHLKEFHKLKYGKRQFRGFILTGVGSFLCFLSCVLTMINPIPDWNNFFLYGLTSVGICMVIYGLYLVFE